jgi:CubicO group peptidase (beta-lactamase class C family)
MMSHAEIVALSLLQIVLAGCGRAGKQESQPQAVQQSVRLAQSGDYGLPRADPESLGLSPEKLAAVKIQLNAFVEQGKLPGLVVAVARDGKLAYFEAWGMRDVERAKPMTPDTIFRMRSMTKPITGAAVMMLVDAGKVSLDDPVSKYIPEFNDMKVLVEKRDGSTELVAAERPITLKHLMTHTSGLVYDFDIGKLGELYRQKIINENGDAGTSLEEFAKHVAALPLKCQPGKEWHYGINMDILGRVVEVVTGRRYADFLQDNIVGPLSMRDAAFYVPATRGDRLAALYGPAFYVPAARGDRLAALYGSKKDAAAMTLIEDPAQSRFLKVPSQDEGGGGLVCTAGDYLRFAQMLLNGGELDGIRILSAKAVAEMTSNQLPPELGDSPIHVEPFLPGVSLKGVGFGYCGATPLKGAVNTYFGDEGEYTWSGRDSTAFWIDRREGIIGVVLTQLRPSDTYPIRPITHNGIKAAIVKSRAARG